MLSFDKTILFPPLLESDLSVSLSIKTWAFTIFRGHKYSSLFYICNDLIMLLHTFFSNFF